MNLSTRQKMIAARLVQQPVLAARRVFGRGPVLRTRRGGIHWELDLREGIDFAIWLQGSFEPSTVAAYRRVVEPGATVVDIGANVGAHTMILAEAVGPEGHVIAFEPVDTAFKRLHLNMDLNPDLARRIDTRQAMLMRSEDANVPSELPASWPLLRRRELHKTVPGRAQPTAGARALTLDTALAQLDVDRVDFIKLDVDGYECDVLGGATKTLEAYRPPILTELAPFVLEGTGRDINELLEMFAANDYELRTLRDSRLVTAADVDQLRKHNASMNVLATHREGATRRTP